MTMVSSSTSFLRSGNKLILTGWGNSASKTEENGSEVKNPKSNDGMSHSGSTNAEPKPTMLDDRMSEGTGLISNDFQVEASL
jgi:hypothetical protein